MVPDVVFSSSRLSLPGDDRQFYSFPRLVTHVDDAFLERVTKLYDRLIPEGGDVLDLQSSHVSHLPSSKQYGRVLAHGMNAQELARNKQADSFFVRDLNAEPQLPAVQDSRRALRVVEAYLTRCWRSGNPMEDHWNLPRSCSGAFSRCA